MIFGPPVRRDAPCSFVGLYSDFRNSRCLRQGAICNVMVGFVITKALGNALFLNGNLSHAVAENMQVTFPSVIRIHLSLLMERPHIKVLKSRTLLRNCLHNAPLEPCMRPTQEA